MNHLHLQGVKSLPYKDSDFKLTIRERCFRDNGEQPRRIAQYQWYSSIYLCKVSNTNLHSLIITLKAEIFRCDSCAAVIMETKPRFDDIGIKVEDDPKNWTPYNDLTIRYHFELLTQTGNSALSSEVIELYWGLRNLSALKDGNTCSMDIRMDQFEAYINMLESLERRIVYMVQNPALQILTQDLAIYKLFAYAALLHTLAFLHDQIGVPLLRLQADRMRNSLESVDITMLKIQYPEMMLWIFVMGGIGGPDPQWWAYHVADLCLSLNVTGGNEIALKLGDFLWMELYRSPATVSFWTDVAAAQGLDGAYEVRKVPDHISLGMFNTTSMIDSQ